MKRFLLFTGIVALGALGANGQKSGGSSPGSQGGAAQPAPFTPPATTQPSAPGNRDQSPSTAQNQNQSPSISITTSNNSTVSFTNQFGATNQFGGGTNQSGGGTNQFGSGTNQVGGSTNQFGGSATNQSGASSNQFGGNGTNQFGGTNQLSPTSSPGATNRVFGTNAGGRFGTNGASQNDMRSQDHAFTERDKAVLAKVREAVLPRIQANGKTSPVHFSVSQGVVTLLGSVQTIQMRQEIEQIIIQTPGVVNVVDQLVVGGGSDGTVAVSDQELLARVRQAVLPQIQTAGTFAPAVDFSVNQGVVTVMGMLPTAEESQRVVTLVRQVPGVVQVADQVRVNLPAAPAPNTSGFPATQPR